MYATAYNYLNKSTKSIGLGTNKELTDNCNQIIKGAKLEFKKELQVASKFIENYRGFPICDFLKRRYKMTENCVYALGSGKFELAEHVQDSLELFWKNYQMKTNSKITETMEGLISEEKAGFIVFFSDIYKNTLAAEVKSFCLPYDRTTWQGSSISFYFIFNDTGDILEVYSGVSIHYD